MEISGLPINFYFFPLFIRYKNVPKEESILIFNKLMRLLELPWNPDIGLISTQAVKDINEKFKLNLDYTNPFDADLELKVLFIGQPDENYFLFNNVINYRITDGNGKDYTTISLINSNQNHYCIPFFISISILLLIPCAFCATTIFYAYIKGFIYHNPNIGMVDLKP